MCFECDRVRVTRRALIGTAGVATGALALAASGPVSPRVAEDPEIGTEELSFTCGGTEVCCYLAHPKSTAACPAVVISHGNPGLPPDILFTARRLARAGIAALVVDPGAHSPPMPEDQAGKDALTQFFFSREFVELQLEDLESGLELLKKRPSVNRERLGLVGFCGGGRLALLFAARSKEPRAIVALHAAVRYHQRRNASDPVPDVMDVAGEIRAPVQGHYGMHDSVALPDDARQFEEALHAREVPVEMFFYPDAGHSFCNFMRPPGSDPGFDYDPDAAWFAHERMLAFLRKRLG